MEQHSSEMPRPVETETVTSLTARDLNPAKATATIFKDQGVIFSLWQLAEYLLEAIGVKAAKKLHGDYEHADLDVVAERGNFPYRPSDLFLKVLDYAG
jgi:hypothetical protein